MSRALPRYQYSRSNAKQIRAPHGLCILVHSILTSPHLFVVENLSPCLEYQMEKHSLINRLVYQQSRVPLKTSIALSFYPKIRDEFVEIMAENIKSPPSRIYPTDHEIEDAADRYTWEFIVDTNSRIRYHFRVLQHNGPDPKDWILVRESEVREFTATGL